ncbi:MAG: hypothetical protein KDD15_03805 [Lewinella sp.]|nr:hypothetical protein [Lewinella sp.]
MLRNLLLIFFPFIFFTCVQPAKLIEQGEYARALKISSTQLRHGRIKATELATLETSFFLLTKQDSQRVADLQATGQPEVWPEIFQLAGQIDRRQEEVYALLQELSGSEYYPNIIFYPAKALVEEAAEKSALYHYANAQEFIPSGRAGDRLLARQAYDELIKSLYYVPAFKDAKSLSEEMRELGTTHLLLNPIAHPRWDTFHPWAVDNLLWGHDFPERLGWLIVYLEPGTAPKIDCEADFYFSTLSVSSNRESRSTCTSTKEVEDGYIIKKVWSEKDSAYVEVKEIKYTTVSGTITTIQQEKDAEASLRFTVIDADTYEPLSTDHLWGNADWSNEYSEQSGDSRALPGSCSTVAGTCSMYPFDGSLLSEAVSNLRWSFWRKLQEAEHY